MKKKIVILFLCMLVGLSACGVDSNEENIGRDNKTNVVEDNKNSEILQEDKTEITYEGEYASCDIDEPMLFIQKNEDGTYAIQVGVYRLAQFDNCVGVIKDGQLEFFTKDYGEDKEVTGTITLDGDIATVTFSAPWSDSWFKDVDTYQYYKITTEQSQTTENEQAGEVTDSTEKEVETIQDEIARIEKQSKDHLAVDTTYMAQQEMNYHSAQWYELWDDELNSLWSRLSKELDAETKAKVLEEQRAWIKRKEGNTVAAGVPVLGGSLRPLLESERAAEMTRARVYVLAGYLAEVRKESFTISDEIQESLDEAEPSLESVFAKFEGRWIFDEARGACIGIEPTESCEYGVEGSTWTVWVTGGDLFSDLDVYGYTKENILFKLSSGVYYELSFGIEGEVFLTYMPSLELVDYNDFVTMIGY